MKIKTTPPIFGDLVICYILERILKGPAIDQSDEYSNLIEKLSVKKNDMMSYYLKDISYTTKQKFKHIHDIFNEKTQTSEHIEINQDDTLNIRLKSIKGPDGKQLKEPLNVYLKSLKDKNGKSITTTLNKYIKSIKDTDGKVLDKSLNQTLKGIKGPNGKTLKVPLNVWLKSVKDKNGDLLDSSLNVYLKNINEDIKIEKIIRKTLEKSGRNIINEEKFTENFVQIIIDEIKEEENG